MSNEVEPRVVTADLARVLEPFLEDTGDESIARLARRSGVPGRTIQNIVAQTYRTTSLDAADRLCVAVKVHLSACRLVWPPDDSVTDYFDRPVPAPVEWSPYG